MHDDCGPPASATRATRQRYGAIAAAVATAERPARRLRLRGPHHLQPLLPSRGGGSSRLASASRAMAS